MSTTSPVPATAEQSLAIASPTSPSPPSQMEYTGYQAGELYGEYLSQNDTAIGALTTQASGMGDLGQHYSHDAYSAYPGQYETHLDPTFYTLPSQVFVRQPLNYHLYAVAMPPAFISSNSDTHFVPPTNDLHTTLQKRSEAIHQTPPEGLSLPDETQGYHSLLPLDSSKEQGRYTEGIKSTAVYRAICTIDGAPYALRRAEGVRLSSHAAFEPVEKWVKIRHPGIIALKEAFTTRGFKDDSLVLVYAYHANAKTLQEVYKRGPNIDSKQAQFPLTPVPERTLWSYIVQIATAIKQVHDAGLAVKILDVSKIVLTGQNRVRLSACGFADMYPSYEHTGALNEQQQGDLLSFGRVILHLAGAPFIPRPHNQASQHSPAVQQGIDLVYRTYGQEMKSVVSFLLDKKQHKKNIDTFLDHLKGRLVIEFGEALTATDHLENELLSALENARLVRLLCKFGFINERPEFARDVRWSETGDRYIIKLFRDYVFHQVDENGNPNLNLSHVLACLNKLDAGTDEKVMLVSRDEQSCLVVSYKEIKQCINSAFSELSQPPMSNIGHRYR
ncbi:hypothetical protein AX16_001970 [Volvariella volvacea WC 439]|nr:hypothetical protein AX16_001970 [Volvariella volvacea WC 439]